MLCEYNFCAAIISGAIGGIANSIIFEKGFVLPLLTKQAINDTQKTRIELGFINNILLGSAAGVIVWGLGATDFDYPKLLATCLLAGVSGGSLITNIMQQQQISLQTEKIESLYTLLQQATGLINEFRDEVRKNEDTKPEENKDNP